MNCSSTRTTEDETLRAAIAAHGTVVSCDTGDVRNGRKRGWAIVEMGSAEEANYVISMMNDNDFEGRPLNVRIDQKPEKPAGGARSSGKGGGKRGGDPALEDRPENSSGLQIVVRNLPWNVTSEMLRGTFEQIGDVADAEVVYHADSGRSKGWGTVKFTDAAVANDAIARFGGVELAGRPMVIRLDRFN